MKIPFFKIKFVIQNMYVLTEAIKVVSKPAQLASRKASNKRKKRNPNDRINEALGRIEQQQKEQQLILGTLLQSFALGLSPARMVPENLNPLSKSNEQQRPPLKKRKLDSSYETQTSTTSAPVTNNVAEKFEEHLIGLIETFKQITPTERSEVVRKVTKNANVETKNQMTEVLDCLWVEGLQQAVGTNVETGSPYSGASMVGLETLGLPDLPLDSIYQDFLNPNLLTNF